MDKFIDEIMKEDKAIMDHLKNSEVTSQGNVVPLKPKVIAEVERVTEKCVFICGACECRTFNLFDDGTIACAYCEEELRPYEGGGATQGQWRTCLPPVPQDRSQLETEAGTVNVNHLGDTSLARRHVVKKLNDWNKDDQLAMIVGYAKNAASHGWFGIESEEQRGWMLEKIDSLRKHIADMIIEEDLENVIKGKPDGQ